MTSERSYVYRHAGELKIRLRPESYIQGNNYPFFYKHLIPPELIYVVAFGILHSNHQSIQIDTRF
jgi:hypothetical protein